jgi:DNA-directed RNA polymerase specialized sigma54-like protein
MLKQHLQLKLGQKLAPQQIQLMKLIQLHTLEFEEELERELEENPALEIAKEDSKEDEYSSLKMLIRMRVQKALKQILTSMNIFMTTNQAIKLHPATTLRMMKNLIMKVF